MFKLQLYLLSHFQKLSINTICLSFPSVWCSSRALLNPVLEILEKNWHLDISMHITDLYIYRLLLLIKEVVTAIRVKIKLLLLLQVFEKYNCSWDSLRQWRCQEMCKSETKTDNTAFCVDLFLVCLLQGWEAWQSHKANSTTKLITQPTAYRGSSLIRRGLFKILADLKDTLSRFYPALMQVPRAGGSLASGQPKRLTESTILF